MSDCGAVGLILVDHGSKKHAANEMLHEVVDLFKRVTGYSIVEAAHMELAAPTVQQAFDACVARGARMVVIHPYFLSPGRHSTDDIPRMAKAAAAKHPGVEWRVTEPLGISEKIAQVILERIDECLESLPESNAAEAALCGQGYIGSEAMLTPASPAG